MVSRRQQSGHVLQDEEFWLETLEESHVLLQQLVAPVSRVPLANIGEPLTWWSTDQKRQFALLKIGFLKDCRGINLSDVAKYHVVSWMIRLVTGSQDWVRLDCCDYVAACCPKAVRQSANPGEDVDGGWALCPAEGTHAGWYTTGN